MDSKSILNCSSSLIYESYKIENSDKRNIENTANSDLTMKKSSFGDARPSQFKLLTYVAPIIEVKKPKNLNGPFDTLDIQNIRQAIQKRLKNNCYRKKQEEKLSHEFVDVMNLNEYFEKKNNWIDKSKFVNTYSLYKSMNTYLPGYNMSFTKLPVQVYKQSL